MSAAMKTSTPSSKTATVRPTSATKTATVESATAAAMKAATDTTTAVPAAKGTAAAIAAAKGTAAAESPEASAVRAGRVTGRGAAPAAIASSRRHAVAGRCVGI